MRLLFAHMFSWAAVALGLASAYYWYKASTAKITIQENQYKPGVEIVNEDPNVPGGNIYVIASAMEQSRLNKIAALITAASVLCQAVSIAISA